MKDRDSDTAAMPGVVDTVETVVRRRRLVDKTTAADYLSASADTVERLIATGALPVVKLPVESAPHGPRVGVSRRVLIDVRDLDSLIERSKESTTPVAVEPPARFQRR